MNIELEPNERRVRTRYNQINQIWEIDDSWHQHSFKSSRKLVSRFFDKAHLRGKTVLNLGSGDTIDAWADNSGVRGLTRFWSAGVEQKQPSGLFFQDASPFQP